MWICNSGDLYSCMKVETLRVLDVRDASRSQHYADGSPNVVQLKVKRLSRQKRRGTEAITDRTHAWVNKCTHIHIYVRKRRQNVISSVYCRYSCEFESHEEATKRERESRCSIRLKETEKKKANDVNENEATRLTAPRLALATTRERWYGYDPNIALTPKGVNNFEM